MLKINQKPPPTKTIRLFLGDVVIQNITRKDNNHHIPGHRTAIWPTQVASAISVAGADRHTGQSEQHEYSTAGEL